MRARSTTETTALARVTVDGCPIYRDQSDVWIYDLDLAERAQLKKPHDIRTTIAKMIEEHELIIVGAADNDPTLQKQGSGNMPRAGGRNSKARINSGGAGNDPTLQKQGSGDMPRAGGRNSKARINSGGAGNDAPPLVRVEITSRLIGKGGRRSVKEYFLSHEAALAVLFRLRTAESVNLRAQLARMLSHVFKLAEQGRLASTAPAQAINAEQLRKEVRAVVREETQRSQLALRAALDERLATIVEEQLGRHVAEQLDRGLPAALREQLGSGVAKLLEQHAFKSLLPVLRVEMDQMTDQRFRNIPTLANVRDVLLTSPETLDVIDKRIERRLTLRQEEQERQHEPFDEPSVEEELIMQRPVRHVPVSPEELERRATEARRRAWREWRSREIGKRVEPPTAGHGLRFYEAIRPALDHRQERVARVLGCAADEEGFVQMGRQRIARGAQITGAVLERILAGFAAEGWLRQVEEKPIPRWQLLLPAQPVEVLTSATERAFSYAWCARELAPIGAPVTVALVRRDSKSPRAAWVRWLLEEEKAGRLSLLPLPSGPLPLDAVHPEDAIGVPGRGLLYYVREGEPSDGAPKGDNALH